MFSAPYLREHFRRVVIPGVFALLSLSLLPAVFRFDSRESKVERSGHLAEVHFQPAADPENVFENVYTLHFREYTQGFKLTHLSAGDQYLLANAEKPDNLFTFAYELDYWKQAGAYGKIPLLELASEKNVYLAPDHTGDLMRKSRTLAAFLFLIAFVLTVKYGRETQAHLKSLAPKPLAPGEKPAEGAGASPEVIYDPWLTAFAIQPGVGLATIGFFLIYLVWSIIPGPYWRWPVAVLAALTAFGVIITQVLIQRWHAWSPIAPILDAYQKKKALAPPRPTTSAPKHVKAVELLLKHGGNLNAQNAQGMTALHIASKIGSTETIGLLVKSGATLDVVDENGQTPLHYAVVAQRMPAVQQLIGLGASLLVADNAGEDALALASKNKKAKNTSLRDYLEAETVKAKLAAEKKKAEIAADPLTAQAPQSPDPSASGPTVEPEAPPAPEGTDPADDGTSR